MRTTLRLDSSVIQTLPPPTAMPRPSAPVVIVSTDAAANGIDPRDAALFGARHPDRLRRRRRRRSASRRPESSGPRGSFAGRSATRCRPTSSPPRPRRPRPRSRSDRLRRRCAGRRHASRGRCARRSGPAHSSPTPSLRRRRCSSGRCRPGSAATSRFDPASIAATEFAEAELSPGLSPSASSMPATAIAADRRRPAPIAIRTPLLRRARPSLAEGRRRGGSSCGSCRRIAPSSSCNGRPGSRPSSSASSLRAC